MLIFVADRLRLGNQSKLYCARLALSLHKIREISATDQVAILLIERDWCKFVKFVGN